MKKSDGILSLKKAAKLLNKHSPEGESLAYINPEEAKLLRAHGGSGIMTLAGVPSYLSIFGLQVPFTKPKSDPTAWTGTDILTKVFGYGKQDTGKTDKDDNPIYSPGRSIINDALSVWGALEAKRQQEGLNASEQAEYDRLMNQMTAMTQQFESDVGATPITPKNIPTTIEDVSTFTETTGIPDMITTAQAEGGRIGAFNGGIQGLMPQQGPVGFMPQQGMMPQQGLMPRPGYAFGTEVVESMPTDQMKEIEGHRALGGDLNLERINQLIEKKMSRTNEVGAGIGLSYEEEWELDTLIEMLPDRHGEAQGGRIGAQGGGIMPLLNLGGMEKDYRQDGGFVPIGRKEKADDVPARLSKNEFVFTADAVRAAGGGDIDDGAQRMYNVMKNLEAGGKISQQSQGQG